MLYLSEAIRKRPSASVFDRQEGRDAKLMHVVARSVKKGRCDAEDEIRREIGEKNTQLYLNSSFFILHSSFIIMHRLRVLIVFWASTLVDEFCPIASKE